MKKLLFVSMMAFLMSPAMAEMDKSKHCPKLHELHVVVPKLYRYYFYAINEDGNYFVSKEHKSDKNNGPAFPVVFSNAIYDSQSKKLSCIYIAYAMPGNERPALVNVGDY